MFVNNEAYLAVHCSFQLQNQNKAFSALTTYFISLRKI